MKAQFSTFTRTGAADATTPEPKVQKFAIGYVHNLSRRTDLYATAAYTKNSNGAAVSTVNISSADNAPTFSNTANSSAPGYRASGATGYDFGIRHAF